MATEALSDAADTILSTPDQGWIMLVGVALSFGYTSRLLYAHAEPHIWYDRIDGWVLGLCFGSYMIAWVPFWLYPFDLAGLQARGDERKRCSEMQLDWLQFFWQIVYVTNFASAYLTYDFARSYLDAGGFHIRRNLWLAWLTVKDWYSWAAIICLIPIALIAYFSGGLFDLNFWGLLVAILYAFANAYGIIIFIWLLSHALVELPRRLWYLPRYETQERYACFQAGLAWEDLGKRRLEWEAAVDRLLALPAGVIGTAESRAHWRVPLQRLREEWRITESVVRSMPIASGGTSADAAGGSGGGASAIFDADEQQLQLEAINVELRRAGVAWRRANRTFEATSRRVLHQCGCNPPRYAPGANLPAPALIALASAAARAGRVRPRLQAAASVASAAATSAYERVAVVTRAAVEATKDGADSASTAVQAAWARVRDATAPWIEPVATRVLPIIAPLLDLLRGAATAAWGRLVLYAKPATEAASRAHGVASARGYRLLEETQAGLAGARERTYAQVVHACFGELFDTSDGYERRRSIGEIGGRWTSTLLWGVLLSSAVLLLVSELFLLLQFPREFSWSPPTPADDAPGGYSPTPIGLLLASHGGPPNQVGIFFLSVAVLLACAWSLSRIEMGIFWYRMARPYATDTSSLAFNSAVFCRIAVMLVLNIDYLVLPTEDNELRTSQTRFYCQFARKARLIVPATNGHDYYLLVVPAMVLLLYLALLFDVLAKVRECYSRFFQVESATTFRFGRTAIPWHEDKGRELRDLLVAAHQRYAYGVVACAIHRWRLARGDAADGARAAHREPSPSPPRPPAADYLHAAASHQPEGALFSAPAGVAEPPPPSTLRRGGSSISGSQKLSPTNFSAGPNVSPEHLVSVSPTTSPAFVRAGPLNPKPAAQQRASSPTEEGSSDSGTPRAGADLV